MVLDFILDYAIRSVHDLLSLSIVVISIGLSDAIELKLNSKVHKNHNCPDIMRMKWSNYTIWHAFLSGIKCSWFLLLPLCFIPQNNKILIILSVINMSIPVFTYATGLDKRDIYLSHKLLYAIVPIGIIASIISCFFYKRSSFEIKYIF